MIVQVRCNCPADVMRRKAGRGWRGTDWGAAYHRPPYDSLRMARALHARPQRLGPIFALKAPVPLVAEQQS
jgi:hypothetical protein